MLYSLLRDSIRFYLNNLTRLASIVLPFTIPLGLFAVFYQSTFVTDPNNFYQALPPTVINFLARPAYQVAILLAISAALKGAYPAVGSLWSRGWSLWAQIIFVNIMYCSLVFSGLMFFVLPGIYVIVRLAFCEILVAVEGKDPLTAVMESWRRTQGYSLTLFGGFAAIFIVLVIPAWQIGGVIATNEIPPLLDEFPVGALFSVLGIFWSVFTYRVYHESLTKKAG